MKHILNNLTEEEKNAIREQHEGGMKVMTENFSKLLNTKLGDSKPLVSEQTETMLDEEDSKIGELERDIKRAFQQKVATPKSTNKPGEWSHGQREKSFEEILDHIEHAISKHRGNK